VHEGDELLLIDNHQSRELHISVAQEDQPHVQTLAGQNIRVRVGMRSVVEGQLKRVNPRATLTLKHAALAAPEGGSLAVVAVEKEGDYRFSEHRFDAVVVLPALLWRVIFTRSWLTGSKHSSRLPNSRRCSLLYQRPNSVIRSLVQRNSDAFHSASVETDPIRQDSALQILREVPVFFLS